MLLCNINRANKKRWVKAAFLAALPIVLYLFIEARLAWRPYRRIEHNYSPSAIAFAPDGTLLAIGSGDKTVRLFDVQMGAVKRTLKGRFWEVTSIVFSPDGKMLASSNLPSDHPVELCLWDVQTGQLLRRWRGEARRMSVAFSPDGKILASSGMKSVQLWDVHSGKLLQTLKISTSLSRSADTCVAFAPDGATLAVSGRSPIELWDVRSGKVLGTIGNDSEYVAAFAFAPDGETLASVSRKGIHSKVEVWDTRTWSRRIILIGKSEGPWSVAFSPNSRMLANDFNGTVSLWDAQTGELIHRLTSRYDSGAFLFAFSPDGRTLAVAYRSYVVTLWRVK